MTIFRAAIAYVLMMVAALLGGCVGQDLPQEQAQRADRIGPLEVHIHADYNVFPRRGGGGGGPPESSTPSASAAPVPTTQPAALSTNAGEHDGIATITHNTTTMTVHISTQGSSTQAQSATGGSPGPVSNTPNVSVPISVSPLP